MLHEPSPNTTFTLFLSVSADTYARLQGRHDLVDRMRAAAEKKMYEILLGELEKQESNA